MSVLRPASNSNSVFTALAAHLSVLVSMPLHAYPMPCSKIIVPECPTNRAAAQPRPKTNCAHYLTSAYCYVSLQWLTYLVRMPGIELQNSRNRLLNILTARFVSAEHVNPKFDDLLQAGDRLRLLFKALHPTPDQVVGLVALQKSCFLLQPGGPTGVHWVLDRFLWDVQVRAIMHGCRL